MRLTNILLAGAAIATISTGAFAQDVVMRRPLPNNAGTPTPGSTDTPSQAITAKGWKVDCQAHDNVCYTVSTDAATNSTTKGQVDDSQCGTTQSAEQQTLAHSAGLIGLGEGVTATSGFESCGTPAETLTAHGWKTDCKAQTTTCAQVSRTGTAAATVVAVDASQCGTSQSAEQQALALQNGLVGLGEGVDASYVPAKCGPTRPQDPPAESGHGWGIDCQARAISCWEMETVEYPWGGTGVSSSQVDANECPATQSGGANALALQNGFYGMGQGVNATHGLEMCNQTSDNYLDYAVGYCDTYSTGKTVTECVRLVMPDPDDGQGPVSQLYLGSSEDAMATCLKPQTNPAWEAMVPALGGFRSTDADDTYGILRQSDIAAFPGRACGPEPIVTYGKTCIGDGTSQCKAVSYMQQSGNIASVENAPSQKCVDETPDDDDYSAIRSAGLMSPQNPDSMCRLPLYASQGQCTFEVTYDPGWPQSGQSHVDSTFKEKCFVIANAEDPANATATPTDLGNCNSQQTSATQAALLQKLEPVFHDPRTIDRTCDITMTVNNAKYVTASETVTGTEKMQQVESQSGVGWYYVSDVQRKTKYACTDDEKYFTDRSAFASRFSTTEVTRCYTDHLQKLQELRDIGTDPGNYRFCGGNDEGEVCGMPFDPAYSVTDDANGEEITVRYSDVRRVPYAENPSVTGIYPK